MVERGLVVVNLDRCIGCHSCQAVCFYGQRDRGYGMVELSRVGGETLTLPQYCRQCDLPACAEACPTEALKFGVHKLVAKIFTTNEPSIALFQRCGFSEVGTHLRHGRLDGEWKDVVVMERSATPA